MKRKIFILLMALLCLVGMTKAQSITLQPQGDGSFGKGCLIPVDVYVDTDGRGVDTVGVVMSSELDFVDFVPFTGDFKHVSYPVVNGKNIRLLSFIGVGDPDFVGVGKIGTVYYKGYSDETSERYSINLLYYNGSDNGSAVYSAGDNYLSEGGWIMVNISDDIEACDEVEDFVEGGLLNQDQDEFISGLLGDLDTEGQQFHKAWVLQQWKKYLLIIVPVVICIAGFVAFLSFYKRKSQGKRS